MIFLPDGSGGWKLAPLDELPKAAAQDARGNNAENEIPEYFVSRFSWEGEIVEDRAELTAEVLVRVLEGQKTHVVRLGLDQAHLLKYECESEGMSVPAPSAPEESGIVWLLRGAGDYRMTFEMRVPLKRTPGGHQLQLNTPVLPQHLVADFKLRIPAVKLSLRPAENVRLLPPEEEANTTIVRGDFSGPRFDLRWVEGAENEEGLRLANTDITLRRQEGMLRLTAVQQLYLSQAGARELEIRLPANFAQEGTEVMMTDAGGAERPLLPVASEREGWMRVPLVDVTGPRIQLRWQFRAPFNSSGQSAAIDGFDIAARKASEARSVWRVLNPTESRVGSARKTASSDWMLTRCRPPVPL